MPRHPSFRSLPIIPAVIAALLCAAQADAQRQPAPARTHRLEAVDVQGEREQCVQRDDPRARQVWEVMRSRYDSLADTLSLWADVQAASGIVAAGQIASFAAAPADPDSLRPRLAANWNVATSQRDAAGRLLQYVRVPRNGVGVRGMSGRFRASWEVRLAQEGYARAMHHNDLDPEPGYWEYPPLAAEMAGHFASRHFGDRQVFAFGESGDTLTLRFCGRPGTRKRPYLRGTLTLRRDSTLLRATWRFVTGDPDDVAGTTVEFRAYDGSRGRPPLLPTRSIFYRRQSLGWFHRLLVFDAWHFAPREELPPDLAPRDRERDMLHEGAGPIRDRLVPDGGTGR